MNRHQYVLCLSTGILVLLSGCGGQTPPQKPNPAAPVTTPEAQTDNTPRGASVVETKLPPPKIDEDSAAGAAHRTFKALEAGNMADAYEFLPPSFQSDIDDLVHEFADRMDSEVWTKLSATLRKAIQVLRTKKDLIFALDLFRDHPEAEPYRKHWDSTLELFNAVVESDITTLTKLKQVTAKSLLSGTALPSLQNFDAIGRAIGADLSRQFAGVIVTPIRSDGAEQIIGLRGPNDEKPMEIVYVKHEGHWLPKSLVEQWPQGIASDRAWLEKLPDRIKAVKPQILEAAYQADDILDQLLAATNREEFERAAGPAILSLATEWPRLHRLAMQAVAGSSENSNVTISINRELTDSEQTKLVAAIMKPLNESGSDYTLLSNDGRTLCRVMRISDVAAIQTSLATHFSLPATAILFDRERSTIQVDLAP